MARQLDFLATGQIVPTSLHVEMERSYLEYAMSVIVGRALPDVRDGLKPVHRRILYAMYELGLTPDRPFRKCARVVGDVLGKYHPHGDRAVYDALVRMVQDFSCRYPLLAGHGNFGSVDDDPPAAMRYTETRLAPIAHRSLLEGIGEAIVDFSGNFDNSQQEPVVLPAQLPILLLNGCTGIAVGMATNIPPHNLGEVVDGSIALIDNPQLPDTQLWQLIPGPDFPTGGELLAGEGIQEAYRTGRGILTVRGRAQIETISLEKRRRKQRTAIVVTELPYQVNKAAWIEKLADWIAQGRLQGIADIRDESDRTGMRVVIELKRETDPQAVLDALYQHTALQTNFGAIFLALVDSQPRQLSLRQLLEEFLKFREQTLIRQYSHELAQAQSRLHLLEGLLVAFNHLDATIDLLRNAPDGATAKVRLQEQLDLSGEQADSLLAMPMRRLTGLEQEKLRAERETLAGRTRELQGLLDDRPERMKALKKELRALKRQFGDQRRTRLVGHSSPPPPRGKVKKGAEKSSPPPSHRGPGSAPPLALFTPQAPPAGAILEITEEGCAGWRPSPPPSTGGDVPCYRAVLDGQERLLAIGDRGKAYPIELREIPPASHSGQLPTLDSLLPERARREAEKVVGYWLLPPGREERDALLLSQQGRIKRLPLSELDRLTHRGLTLMKLQEGDRLRWACPVGAGEDVLIATSGGRVLRWEIDGGQLPPMGRSARGERALRLRYGERLVGCVTLKAGGNVLLVSQLGYGKRLPVSALRLTKLGDIGTQALQFTSKADQLAAMVAARSGETAVLATSQERRLSLAVDSVSLWGKDGPGDRIVPLKGGETVASVAVGSFTIDS